MKRILALLAATMILMPNAARAAAISDPADDVAGRLDIVRVALTGGGAGKVNTLTIKTSRAWGCKFLRRALDTSLKYKFDEGADGDTDLVGNFSCRKSGARWKLWLFLRGPRTGSRYEPVPVSRPSRTAAKVTFPFDLPEIDGGRLGIVARSSNAVSDGCSSGCVDRAPDGGSFRPY